MPFVEDDNMIEAFPAYRADQTLDIWILPGRAGRNEHFVDLHALDPMSEVLTVDVVTVSQQESGSLLVRERLNDLLGCPLGSWTTTPRRFGPACGAWAVGLNAGGHPTGVAGPGSR